MKAYLPGRLALLLAAVSLCSTACENTPPAVPRAGGPQNLAKAYAAALEAEAM